MDAFLRYSLGEWSSFHFIPDFTGFYFNFFNSKAKIEVN